MSATPFWLQRRHHGARDGTDSEVTSLEFNEKHANVAREYRDAPPAK